MPDYLCRVYDRFFEVAPTRSRVVDWQVDSESSQKFQMGKFCELNDAM